MRFLLVLFLFSASLFSAEPLVKVCSVGGGMTYSATAFAVESGVLVTAAHTFEKTVKNGRHFVWRNGVKEPVLILKIDFSQDICVLKTESVNDTCYILAAGAPGDAVTITGFSGNERTVTTKNGLCTKKKKYLETDFSSAKGVSGGPIFNASGAVIGMCVQSDDNKTKCVPAEKIMTFIQMQKPPR